MNSHESFGRRQTDEPVTQLAVGDFRLDLVGRRLLDAQGHPVDLAPRLFDALIYFIEHRGELLDKDQLLAALWPGLVVEENNLNKAVSALRKALGDDGEGRRYLMTVPRRGFRFVAQVQPVVAEQAAPPPAAAPPPEAAKPAAAAIATETPFVRPSPPAPAYAQPAATRDQPPPRRREWLAAGGVAALAAVTGAGLWAWRDRAADEFPVGMTPRKTLAVLPFRPLAEGARDEVLELGMADSLIARLSSARGVIVRPVGAVRRYAGRDTDPLRAARELDVAWVLEGTIQQRGERARVTARLLDVSSGAAVWSGSFDERFTHVFDVQEAISRRVADVLMPRLSERDRGALASSGTRNAEAYRLYLEARYLSQLFTNDAYRRAIALYEQAIAADPLYAYAYTGLAEVHRRTLFTSNAVPRAAFESMRAAARRALEIDPDYGDGLVMVGWVTYLFDWNWPAAEQTFERAMAANPSSVDATYGHAHLLMTTGRDSAALQGFARARQIDPLSLIVNAALGGLLAASGRVEEGLALMRRALAINPEFWIAHLLLGNTLVNTGQTDAGLASLQRATELSSGSAWASGFFGHALGQSGRTQQAREVQRDLQTRSRSGYISPAMIALVHVALGEVEAAMSALERAHDQRDPRLAYLQIDHRWQPLRGDARFTALARRLGLDPAQPQAKSVF